MHAQTQKCTITVPFVHALRVNEQIIQFRQLLPFMRGKMSTCTLICYCVCEYWASQWGGGMPPPPTTKRIPDVCVRLGDTLLFKRCSCDVRLPTTRFAFFFFCVYIHPSIQDIPLSYDVETDDLNMKIESHTDDGSLYVPTPQGIVRENACKVKKCFIKYYLLHELEPI